MFMLMNNIKNFVYKVLTSSKLVCASYDHIYLSIDVLPEAVCCYLQTCNFVVIFILMNNVCVQSYMSYAC